MYVFICVYVSNFLSPSDTGLFRTFLVGRRKKKREKEGYGGKRVEQCGTDMYIAVFKMNNQQGSAV